MHHILYVPLFESSLRFTPIQTHSIPNLEWEQQSQQRGSSPPQFRVPFFSLLVITVLVCRGGWGFRCCCKLLHHIYKSVGGRENNFPEMEYVLLSGVSEIVDLIDQCFTISFGHLRLVNKQAREAKVADPFLYGVVCFLDTITEKAIKDRFGRRTVRQIKIFCI